MRFKTIFRFLLVTLFLGAAIVSLPYILFLLSFILPIFYEPNNYLIPSGFTGHVEIHYGVPVAPPLTKERNHFIITIPKSGILKTASPPPSGTLKYYWVDQQGRKKGPADQCIENNSGPGEGETIYPDGTIVKYPPVERFDVTNRCTENN